MGLWGLITGREKQERRERAIRDAAGHLGFQELTAAPCPRDAAVEARIVAAMPKSTWTGKPYLSPYRWFEGSIGGRRVALRCVENLGAVANEAIIWMSRPVLPAGVSLDPTQPDYHQREDVAAQQAAYLDDPVLSGLYVLYADWSMADAPKPPRARIAERVRDALVRFPDVAAICPDHLHVSLSLRLDREAIDAACDPAFKLRDALDAATADA